MSKAKKEKKGKAPSVIEIPAEIVEEPPKDLRTVTICVVSYKHIAALYPASDVKTHCKYLENDLGESTLVPVTDDVNLPANDTFSFEIDFNSPKEIDQLISSPALLTVWQCAGTLDPTVYPQLVRDDDLIPVAPVKSFDSIVSIYEAFTGDALDVKISDSALKPAGKGKKGDKKGKGKGKDSKSSKPSKESAKTSKASVASKKQKGGSDAAVKETPPVVYGMCAIDFLPLFYGKTSFTETLVINPMEKYDDERMATFKTLPKISIIVSIDKELEFSKQVIMNVTLESIYNPPSLMDPDMDFRVSALLPMQNMEKVPMLFTNPQSTSKIEEDVMKCWPGIQKMGVNANTTKYQINPDDDIKNTVEEEIGTYLKEENPRLQFNTLKRTLLLKEGVDSLSYQFQTFRKVVVEVYMTTRQEQPSTTSSKPGDKKSKDKKSESSVKSKGKGEKKSDVQPFLHLMASLDVSSMLYPGITKVRVASPLSTFTFEEALKAGQDDSYFRPKPKVEAPGESGKGAGDKKGGKDKKEKGKDKSSKGSKGSKKGGKGGGGDDTGDLKPLLPPKPVPPPEPEPSIPVYTEDGKRCFIIVELELSKPINERRDIEDLHEELTDLLCKNPTNLSKVLLTTCLTKDYYKEVLSEITKDIYEKYHEFAKDSASSEDNDFLKYLQYTGAYQTYLTSITKAASLVVTSKFKYQDNDKKNFKLHQNFIGRIFVFLVSEMHDTLNRLICTDLEPVIIPEHRPLDKTFFYAKESLQLGRKRLAERYFVERICNDDNETPDFWFDLGVYYLEINDAEVAFECVREALAKKPNHRYSLLLLGTLLANKEKKDEAETCFLNLLLDEPRWVEGWAVLYLFYQKHNKSEGLDMAQQMINKYADDERAVTDYFTEFEDLAWTYKICPRTVFFRTAVLLLKMRVYCWVEMALAQEIQKHYGLTHYLLSAVCLYQKMYDHALEHIEETKISYGSDYAVAALSGHCLLALNREEEAKNEYYHVLESFNRPDDVHMVFVNCARVLENMGDSQTARKLMLLSCKYSPTPYTWFKAGQLYFDENDLLSAEECFSESNYEDNRCGEVWAFLALVNLKLDRPNEAELCYRQAMKNKLKCPGLLDMIEKECGGKFAFET